MPIFSLRCECGNEIRLLVKKRATAPNCGRCEKKMFFVLAAPGVRAMNTADEYKGKSVVDGVSGRVEERAREFFKNHELPRLIAEEGIDSARSKGFVDEDGNAT